VGAGRSLQVFIIKYRPDAEKPSGQPTMALTGHSEPPAGRPFPPGRRQFAQRPGIDAGYILHDRRRRRGADQSRASRSAKWSQV